MHESNRCVLIKALSYKDENIDFQVEIYTLSTPKILKHVCIWFWNTNLRQAHLKSLEIVEKQQYKKCNFKDESYEAQGRILYEPWVNICDLAISSVPCA